MNRGKVKLITFLIYIFFIGANYLLFSYYVLPLIQDAKAKTDKYDPSIEQLESLLRDKKMIKQIEQEIDDLNKKVENYDQSVPTDIDTPQLIYDFYKYCNKYSITGKTITFELNEISNNDEDSEIVEEIKKDVEETKRVKIKNKNQEVSKEAENNSNYLELEIKLSIRGDKKNVIKSLYHLDTITQRKITVKNISLEPELNSNFIQGLIVFNQYIQANKERPTKNKEYVFYNEPNGFNNISDMFKKIEHENTD